MPVLAPVRKADWEDPRSGGAGRREAEARRVILAALEELRSALSLAEATKLLTAADIRGLERALTEAEFRVRFLDVGEPLGAEFAAAARHAGLRLGLSFDLADERGAAWAATRAATLVTEIEANAMAALRAIASRAIRDGLHPYDAAGLIRDVVGLHSRWATAVYNYRARLVEKGLARARVEELTARKYARLLKARSELIARTEILSSANAGRLEGWRAAGDKGLFNRAHATKEWVAALDERTCPICDDLDGETVSLDGLFSDGSDAPPAHPDCRCSAVLDTGLEY